MTPALTASASAPPGLRPLARLNLALLAVLVIALCALLWPQWLRNAELSHALFMPLIFFLLLRESRAVGPARFLPPRPALTAAIAALLVAGLAALALGGLFAAALAWSHALVCFVLAAALVLFLFAGWLVFAGESIRFVPFNWIAFTAIFLWLLCAPIPPGTYMRLTLGLQLWITRAVLATLHLLGIAAARNGNLIVLGNTTVGVEEACSGVRSLISCVFAGFFFSAALVRRPGARILLVALAAPLALAMNFLRSLVLTLLANHGIDISGSWHDATGYAILGATALLLGGLAMALARNEKPGRPPAAPTMGSTHAARALQPLLASGLTLAAGLVVFFVANTRRAPPVGPAPDLAAILPAQADGWGVRTAEDLYRFTDVLETDHLAQRTYFRRTPDGDLLQVTIYLAYWPAGQAPVSLVASHTPDACWPGSGWVAQPAAARARLTVDGRVLPPAESRLFRNGDFPQHVWFWHIYDGRPIAYRNPYSPRELLRLALRYGFGREGPQLFVRVSSNRDWPAFADDPLLRGIFHRLRTFGL